MEIYVEISDTLRFSGTVNGAIINKSFVDDGKNIFSQLVNYCVDFDIIKNYDLINIYYHPASFFEPDIEDFRLILLTTAIKI